MCRQEQPIPPAPGCATSRRCCRGCARERTVAGLRRRHRALLQGADRRSVGYAGDSGRHPRPTAGAAAGGRRRRRCMPSLPSAIPDGRRGSQPAGRAAHRPRAGGRGGNGAVDLALSRAGGAGGDRSGERRKDRRSAGARGAAPAHQRTFREDAGAGRGRGSRGRCWRSALRRKCRS